MIDRRRLLKSAAVAAAFASTPATAQTPGKKFSLGYAPKAGMFRSSAGKDILDQIRFIADQGFTAFEYNGLPADLHASG